MSSTTSGEADISSRQELESRYPSIYDYGVIGDCRSAALISREGSVDWCCWPRFDSPSIFARILDFDRGGFFQIRPVEPFRSERRYVGASNTLETTFETRNGLFRLTDVMTALPDSEKRLRITPLRELVRRIEALEGADAIEMRFVPRVGYGRDAPVMRLRSPSLMTCSHGVSFLQLASDGPLFQDEGGASARFLLRKGDRRYFSLSYTEREPGIIPVIGPEADAEIEGSTRFWEEWVRGLAYQGPHADAVARSALTLKLMFYAPSGAVVAAPTTSLPEDIGGVRNWDYRYCWLRDASFTVDALYDLGFREEADLYVDWLLHATRLTHPGIGVLYDVYGASRIGEVALEELEGYRGSRPVRVGNAASTQLQIDVYGEVLGALERAWGEGKSVNRDKKRLLVSMARVVEEHWDDPDHGIWEFRSGKAQHLHGKALAWQALDCAVALGRQLGIGNLQQWSATRDRIHDAILSRGFNPGVKSFTGVFGGSAVDASVLVLSRIGFLPGDDPRIISTIDAVRRELAVDDLVYRYRVDDGLPGDEGAFLACSFWLVDALAFAGRTEDAAALFERLLRRGNDLGLFSEEMDPQSGAPLGNFPQALTHIALINSALALQRPESGRERVGSPR